MPGQHEKVDGTLVNNTTYDVLKFIAQIFLPSLGTLYFAVSQIWGWPNATEVVGTLAAVDAFLGALLSLANKRYNDSVEEAVVEADSVEFDGDLVVNDSETASYYVALNEDAEKLMDKDQVVFKVRRPNPPADH